MATKFLLSLTREWKESFHRVHERGMCEKKPSFTHDLPNAYDWDSAVREAEVHLRQYGCNDGDCRISVRDPNLTHCCPSDVVPCAECQ